jgi:amphi-Trp domain-containing protein
MQTNTEENGMKKKQIEVEKLMTREKVADFFRALTEGLRNGSIELRDDEDTLTISPPDIIAVEIGAKQKKDKFKLSMEVSWKCQALAKGE